MSLDSSQKCDEETGLKSMAPEPLELDESYQTPVDIRWGNCYPLFLKNNIPKIVIGPHWPLFICAYSLFVAASIFLIGWHFIIQMIYTTIQALHLNSQSGQLLQSVQINVGVMLGLLYTQFFDLNIQNKCSTLINPGVIIIKLINSNYNYDKNNQIEMRTRCAPQLDMQNDSKTWYCGKCKLLQLHGTVHCSDCDVCIQEMDHHCPWTGKCIGKGNIKQFYYFLASTLIFMIFNIIASLTQLDGALNGTRRKIKQGN